MAEQERFRVLVVEDDESFSAALAEALTARGWAVSTAPGARAAEAALACGAFDVAIVDLGLPDAPGDDVLRSVCSAHLFTETVVLTGQATVESAVAATKLGAVDYLLKPVALAKVEEVVARAAAAARQRRAAASWGADLLETSDPVLAGALSVAWRAAGSDLPLVIEGEPGTGKRHVARALHSRSPRGRSPFVSLGCGAGAESLEAELLGDAVRPGALLLARGGTLFLEDLAQAPLAFQRRLLRVLETSEFVPAGERSLFRADVRLISAADRDLALDVRRGQMDADLLERLEGVRVRIPPLRERRGDVERLARGFLARFGGEGRAFSPAALAALQAYHWPGNVRELEMTVQRLAVLAPEGDEVGVESLPPELLGGRSRRAVPSEAELARAFADTFAGGRSGGVVRRRR